MNESNSTQKAGTIFYGIKKIGNTSYIVLAGSAASDAADKLSSSSHERMSDGSNIMIEGSYPLLEGVITRARAAGHICMKAPKDVIRDNSVVTSLLHCLTDD